MASRRPASQARTAWATPMPPMSSESSATRPEKASDPAETRAQGRLRLRRGLELDELGFGDGASDDRSRRGELIRGGSIRQADQTL